MCRAAVVDGYGMRVYVVMNFARKITRARVLSHTSREIKLVQQ